MDEIEDLKARLAASDLIVDLMIAAVFREPPMITKALFIADLRVWARDAGPKMDLPDWLAAERSDFKTIMSEALEMRAAQIEKLG